MRTLTVVGIALFLCGVSFGSIACPSVDYGNYLTVVNDAGGCTIGASTFTNFTYSATATGGGSVLLATTVRVASVSDPDGFIFTFRPPIEAGVGESSDVTFGYRATNSGGFTGANLYQIQVGVSTGSGQASVANTLCLGGLLRAGCSGGTSVTLTTANSKTTDHILFAPVTTIDVSKDVLTSSNGVGTASISAVSNTLNTHVTPEPMSFLLMGAGLFGLGVLRRKDGRP